jgi:hypothetical protein
MQFEGLIGLLLQGKIELHEDEGESEKAFMAQSKKGKKQFMKKRKPEEQRRGNSTDSCTFSRS